MVATKIIAVIGLVVIFIHYAIEKYQRSRVEQEVETLKSKIKQLEEEEERRKELEKIIR